MLEELFIAINQHSKPKAVKRIEVKYEVGDGLDVLYESVLEPKHYKWRPF